MVSRDTLIINLERELPQADRVIQKYGMGHLGTLIAFFNTLEEAASHYGVNPDLLVLEINELPASKRYAFT